MDLGISGKVALVLGGAGGLGAAIATALAREGATVVIADRNEEGLRTVHAHLRSQGLNCHPERWDLGDLNLVEDKVTTIESRVGSVQILVNNTGGPPPSAAYGLGPDVWREHFEKMVQAPIAITDRVLPGMREKRWGRVITSASSGVVSPIPNLAVSNSLRSALVGWSKSLAREVAADGVTTNIVVPGRIATDRIRFLDEQKAKRDGTTVEAVSAQSTSSIPVGRYGQPDEYADVIAFLASERASYVTGSIIRVDGGLISSV
jgi:3-oxoacyl-[acyl-carrier protein] reductase